MPVQFDYTNYRILGAGGSSEIDFLCSRDTDYFMKRHGLKLTKGRLPQNCNEIALNANVAKNRGKKVGDKIGDKVDKFDQLSGEYTVVGLLEGTDGISIGGYRYSNLGNISDTKLEQTGLLAFPKPGKLDAAGNALRSYASETVYVSTLSSIEKQIDHSIEAFHVLDLIAVLAVLVMVVCLVTSKYAQFYSRKTEFGILHAMGYTRKEIIRRAAAEVTAANGVSLILGIGIGLICSVFIVGGLIGAQGGVSVIICTKALVLSVIPPIFTTLFTLIPVFRMLGKIDPITVIEAD